MKTVFDKTNLKNNTLKNRFFRSATWMAMADKSGHINNEIIDVYDELAKGNVAGIITGITSIHPSAELLYGMMCFHDDSYIKEHKKLTDKVHEHGSLIFLQTAIADFYSESFYNIINELSTDEIEGIIHAFIDSAVRAQKAGYDGVQIHAAHFFFLSKFISPLFNRRSDKYGGSNKNRARILVEIIEGIQEVVNNDFITLIKINCSDFEYGGIEKEDFHEICQIIDKAGIDAIEVSGNNTSKPGIKAGFNEAYFLEYAEDLKVNCQVILVGGHRSIENMDKILNTTNIEYLSMSRPLLREPELINRWKNGDTAPSKCVSCNKCYQTINHKCIFNQF